MSDTVIKVDNLSKRYIIGHQKQERYTALRDVITNKAGSLIKGLFGRAEADADVTKEEFYALKDVSFEIKQGERVGIIGRNGAGKSTLLKILSRITEPTTGRIEIKGRVASLLEVGTGFHPELTGRENIFLNGAILGMARAEIRKKFDEIVAFAEIEKFLDTPVKRYSSGMHVRLAFAVAAHLEPEILIVDEVLAVGDAQFQKKCLGKMEEVGQEGRTVLFVSHNMGTVNHLCASGILLKNGAIHVQGNIKSVIAAYEKNFSCSSDMIAIQNGLIYQEKQYDNNNYKLCELSVNAANMQGNSGIKTLDEVIITIKYYAPVNNDLCTAALFFYSMTGHTLLRMATNPDANFTYKTIKGINTLECRINRVPLTAGTYKIGFGLAIAMQEWLYFNDEVALIEVNQYDYFNSGFAPMEKYAVAFTDYKWSVI